MNYKFYTIPALRTDLDSLKRMKQLIKEMNKPENFTYVDVVNLHNYIDCLVQIVSTELNSRLQLIKPTKHIIILL